MNNLKTTPLKAIRKKCLWCMCDVSNEVRLCTCGDTCTLYPYRFGKKPEYKPALTPLKSIKAKCYDCSGFSKKEQRNCEFKECDLWLYRLGHNPKRKGIGGNIGNLNKPDLVKNMDSSALFEPELINA